MKRKKMSIPVSAVRVALKRAARKDQSSFAFGSCEYEVFEEECNEGKATLLVLRFGCASTRTGVRMCLRDPMSVEELYLALLLVACNWTRCEKEYMGEELMDRLDLDDLEPLTTRTQAVVNAIASGFPPVGFSSVEFMDSDPLGTNTVTVRTLKGERCCARSVIGKGMEVSYSFGDGSPDWHKAHYTVSLAGAVSLGRASVKLPDLDHVGPPAATMGDVALVRQMRAIWNQIEAYELDNRTGAKSAVHCAWPLLLHAPRLCNHIDGLLPEHHNRAFCSFGGGVYLLYYVRPRIGHGRLVITKAVSYATDDRAYNRMPDRMDMHGIELPLARGETVETIYTSITLVVRTWHGLAVPMRGPIEPIQLIPTLVSVIKCLKSGTPPIFIKSIVFPYPGKEHMRIETPIGIFDALGVRGNYAYLKLAGGTETFLLEDFNECLHVMQLIVMDMGYVWTTRRDSDSFHLGDFPGDGDSRFNLLYWYLDNLMTHWTLV